MQKFLLLTIGYETPTPEIMNAWMQWFKSIEGSVVEQVGLMNGKEITPNDIIDLQMGRDAITGYLIIKANNIDEALEVAKACPMVTSTRVYEIRSNH
jgi:D-arabinose 1-dehydrogenase-like Zn-dependent alcohol dehydrogenase